MVVGGGLVGLAIAYGVRRLGLSVTVLDGGDDAHRASRGNFALVWGQGKGFGAPDYARWTQASLSAWPGFAAELADISGVDLHYRGQGGFHLCFDEGEFERRGAMLERHAAELSADAYPFEMVPASELRRTFPHLGPTMAGASYSPRDGDVNSLHLYRALITALRRLGGSYRPGAPATGIARDGAGFAVVAGGQTFRARTVVIAAGIETERLAGLVGMSVPVRPQTGQIIVTEKAVPFLPYAVSTVRQTNEGGVMLGDSVEERGHDDTVTTGVLGITAARAIAAFPVIARLAVVRSWAALRVMSPDGLPVYQQSASQPGAFACICHSGVTLAAIHAGELARQVAGGALTGQAAAFGSGRFDVRAA